MSAPRLIAEQHFAQASADGAIFELRVHLTAGADPDTAELSIKTNLEKVIDEIIEHHRDKLGDGEPEALQEARYIRNKILHCEFSTTREKLGRHQSGSVIKASGIKPGNAMTTLNKLIAGEDVGQQAVSDSNTKKQSDVSGWLLDSYKAEDFIAASAAFKVASAILERLLEPPPR